MSDTVAVQDLRTGMFIHLDLGWMSHPFPRSSFRISGPDQIATLHGLGLKQVRWSPERSELPAEPSRLLDGVGAAVATPAHPVPTEIAEPHADATPAAAGDGHAVVNELQLPLRLAVASSPRAHSPHCERQYTEAGRTMRELHQRVSTQPQAAGQAAQLLATQLVGQVRQGGEVSMRLLGQPFGDPLAAHAVNVTVVSLLLGQVLGLDDDEMLDLGVGALVHDAGTLELPEALRHADQRLSALEMQAWRDHVEHGVEQGRRMGLTIGALRVVAQHHEHADGSGFPARLNADRMSVAARVVALVDRFDTLCNPGPLAKSLTPHEALSLIFAQCRTQYDTAMLNAFIRMVGVYPAGSVVQLTDDRWAMVVGVNSARPLKPRVLVHDGGVPREDALLLNLETLPNLGIRRSVHPRQLPDPAFEYLQPRPRVGYFLEAAPHSEPQAELQAEPHAGPLPVMAVRAPAQHALT